MNTTALKKFAATARVKIKNGVALKLMEFGFDGEGHVAEDIFPQQIQGATLFRGQYYPEQMCAQWNNLYNRVQEKGIHDVYEEVAYTWFNRIVAIRILQKNGFINPVLSFVDGFTRMPQIVMDAKRGRLPEISSADRMRLQAIMQDESKVVEQFSMLLTAFCHSNPILNNCFGKVADYTELLLPNDILAEGGFIDMLNHTDYITEEDYRTTELLGWLYQFYISERKDEVFASFKNGKKAETTDEIAAATQIFTPNWIVKYMVQNTIGRIYLDNEPYTDLKQDMAYLVDIEPVEKERQLHYTDLSELTMIDPACGSGHILLEGFDLYLKMYQESGYTVSQGIEQIFCNNLIGIELDTRAKQLSTFALLLKACQNDRSFVDAHVMPRVIDMPKVDTYTWRDLNGHMACAYDMSVSETVNSEMDAAFTLLKQADNLGSIMKFSIGSESRRFMQEALEKYESDKQYHDNFADLMHGFRLILALTDKYAAVVANPPYMGSGNMNDGLSSYVKDHYAEGKGDLCTVFVQLMGSRIVSYGRYAFIIPPSWMFLPSFESLRKSILTDHTIESFLQLSNGAFDGDFGSTPCVIKNAIPDNHTGIYFRIVEKTFQYIDQDHLRMIFLNTLKDHSFRFNFSSYSRDGQEIQNSEHGNVIYYDGINQKTFFFIPGTPIAYWLSKNVLDCFHNSSLLDRTISDGQTKTGDNNKYLRMIWEVSSKVVGKNKKWVKHPKGGSYRRWYGNIEWVIDWSTEARTFYRADRVARILPEYLWWKKGISWTLLTSGLQGYRDYADDCIFNLAAPTLFFKEEEDRIYTLGLLNTKITTMLQNVFNPTINNNIGDIQSIPYIKQNVDNINDKVEENVQISRSDWDAHETSWNFHHSPLMDVAEDGMSYTIAELIEKYKEHWSALFHRLHQNEEELNRQFIEIYGLQDELTPDVPLDEVTILQQGEIKIENNQIKWNDDVLMKQLLSYAVGVTMGRYRLDKPGLHIAHPNPTNDELAPYTYQGHEVEIDDDAIIPILPEDSPFADNLCNRVKEFVRVVFKETELTQNLNTIEQALGKTINDYLQKDFYTDHKKMYQNKPIYWLFSSCKGAFRCLVYMHRMDAYTAEKVRSKYLLPYMETLRQKIEYLRSNIDLTGAQRRELTNLQKAYDECRDYHEQLHTVAGEQIAFDLDDGVSVNYAKFGNVLAKLK